MTECLTSKKSNCKNCYKCIRNCPVKSIGFSNNQASILHGECILCGKCVSVCPQDVKQIRDDLPRAKELLNSGAKVYASIAPSFIANYDDVTINSMRSALKKLGFEDAEETAIGATIVKKKYDEIVNSNEQDVIISSCCHSVNLLIQKHFPSALQYLAKVVTPMQAHSMDIKRRHPGAKTVFIGPCISKKGEADTCSDSVDCVLTFGELTRWLKEQNISFEHEDDFSENTKARLFPTTGGILRTMKAENPKYTYMAVDGFQNCIDALEDIVNGGMKNCFIEMSICPGSCIAGPAMEKKSPIKSEIAVDRYAKEGDFDVFEYSALATKKDFEPLSDKKINLSEEAIRDVLKKLGKTKPEDELNCGTCGYETCREKAKAVLLGKATLEMCLPYLKEKAESFSDTIIDNTPNSVIVLNEQFEVVRINHAACKLINVSASAVEGNPVVRILDPTPFISAYQSGKNEYSQRVYLAEYGKYVEQSIIYDKSYHIIICIMRDITEAAKNEAKKHEMSRATIEITDKVIEKQMRTVQEIASLLGETTAETKVALTKLKESLKDE